MKYVFILGHNPKLSVAEILAVLPKAKVANQSSSFLIVAVPSARAGEDAKIDCEELMKRMGGSIKIAEVMADKIDKKLIVEELKRIVKLSEFDPWSKPKALTIRIGKLNFGLSYYECKKDKLGMEIKGALKKVGISCRLVVGKDKALSSVILKKNKVFEFLIIQDKYLAKTCAIQDFEDYGRRDFARPERNLKSGSMPPKLAQIMINLAQVDMNGKIYDPFCGSGTIIQEALVMGYKNVTGSDNSEKAVSDTNRNLAWLERSYKTPETKVDLIDVRELSQQVKNIDAIVTEPYLGPPLKGGESREQLLKNIAELEDLYTAAFEQFREVLNEGGRVSIIFPTFRASKEILELKILDKIKELGFIQTSKDDLFYSREDQKVFRNVRVFTLQS